MLDGDVVRTNLSKGLGFSKEDRDTNILRIGWVCEVGANDVVAIGAAISPYREIRDRVRASIGRFVEVFMEAPLEVLADRDPKGLYRKAMAGEISNFTGVTIPTNRRSIPKSCAIRMGARQRRNQPLRSSPSSANWGTWGPTAPDDGNRTKSEGAGRAILDWPRRQRRLRGRRG